MRTAESMNAQGGSFVTPLDAACSRRAPWVPDGRTPHGVGHRSDADFVAPDGVWHGVYVTVSGASAPVHRGSWEPWHTGNLGYVSTACGIRDVGYITGDAHADSENCPTCAAADGRTPRVEG